MKWWWRMAGLIGLMVLGWWAWQRIFVTDEQRIQRLIGAMVKAVETGNLLKLESGIAQDYSDDFGLDKSSLLGAVRAFRAQADGVLILISDLKVTVETGHQKAQAVFVAKVFSKPKGSLADAELRTDRFRLLFRRSDQGWQMIHAASPQLNFE